MEDDSGCAGCADFAAHGWGGAGGVREACGGGCARADERGGGVWVGVSRRCGTGGEVVGGGSGGAVRGLAESASGLVSGELYSGGLDGRSEEHTSELQSR